MDLPKDLISLFQSKKTLTIQADVDRNFIHSLLITETNLFLQNAQFNTAFTPFVVYINRSAAVPFIALPIFIKQGHPLENKTQKNCMSDTPVL
jgi:hypothetical protein